MTETEKYEYARLREIYGDLVEARWIMSQANAGQLQKDRRDAIISRCRASLRSLDAYQPTEPEVYAADNKNNPVILEWIRRSRPKWDFIAHCEE